MELRREHFRPVFHWRFSQFYIALFCGLGMAMIAFPIGESHWPFTLAYIFFAGGLIWSLGSWLTSDYLHKNNPSTWSKSRRKRATRDSRNNFLLLQWGVSFAILIPFA